jgi:hypothetical protein
MVPQSCRSVSVTGGRARDGADDGAMARWRDGAMARWRDGAMVKTNTWGSASKDPL